MVSQREKRQMMDYISARLENEGRQVVSIAGNLANCIYLQDKGLVLMVDRVFPKSEFPRAFAQAKEITPNVAAVVYKDGETFFRSAAAGEEETGIRAKHSKLRDDRSLKNYTSEDMKNVISFRPEEEFLRNRNGGWVQYYQPQSDRLQEGIVSYRFEPVTFDYSHIPDSARFGPIQKDSERLRIWKQKGFNSGALVLKNSRLEIKPETQPVAQTEIKPAANPAN
jgi:hypothetical protein